MQRSYKETINYYEELRKIIYEFVREEYSNLGINVREIRYHDSQEAENWTSQWKNKRRVASWEWTKLYNDYKSHAGVKRFDISLHSRGKLVALCYGVPSRGKLILKLHALERSPVSNPIRGKVLSIILFAANAYARLINSEEIWLCNPVSKAHVRLYSKAGFEPQYINGIRVTHLIGRVKQ